MAEDKKVFLRIAAAVCAFEGEFSKDNLLRRAWMIPISSDSQIVTMSLDGDELKKRALLIDLEKSLDKHMNADDPKNPLPWDQIQIEGIGVNAKGVPSGAAGSLVLNSFSGSWPFAKTFGHISLEESFLREQRDKLKHRPDWPFEGFEPYQCMSVLYSKDFADPRAGKRYVGFKVRVIKRADGGNMLKVQILKGTQQIVQREAWVSLDDLDDCDSAISLDKVLDKTVTTLPSDPEVGAIGGLFLGAAYAAELGLVVDPKTPYVTGL